MELSMRLLFVVLSMTLIAGCELTPTQKRWAGFAAGVLVVGAVAAHDSDNGKPPTAGPSFEAKPMCYPQPDGSCR
jgi:hypothetical protein